MLISVHGLSGSGKTLSSLLMARGLAGSKGKVCAIDTERKRMKVHAGRADIGALEYFELTPPFSPERYVEALEQIYALKPDVLVMDSASHEWDGEGGLSEIAEATSNRGLLKWTKPKARHKKFMRCLLRAPCHVIICFRSKRKFEQQKGGGDEAVKYVGLVPIQEFGFIYETTVQLRLDVPDQDDHGKRRGIPVIERCPDDLLPVFGTGQQISIATGAAVREWCRGAASLDRKLVDLTNAAREAAGGGVDAYKTHWEGLTKGERAKLEAEHANLKSIAQQADDERKRVAESERETVAEKTAGGPFDWNAYMIRIKAEIDMAAPHGAAMITKILHREIQNMTDAPADIGRMIREHAQQASNPKGRKT